MIFSIYDSTGLVNRVLHLPDPSYLSDNLKEGESYILGDSEPSVDFVINNQIIKGTRPTPSYIELRTAAYPPLQTLADAIYWQSQGDNSKMMAYLDEVTQVKVMYPKGA